MPQSPHAYRRVKRRCKRHVHHIAPHQLNRRFTRSGGEFLPGHLQHTAAKIDPDYSVAAQRPQVPQSRAGPAAHVERRRHRVPYPYMESQMHHDWRQHRIRRAVRGVFEFRCE
jgi:hypothetical protein